MGHHAIGGFGQFLNAATKNAAKKENTAVQIVEIDMDKLIPNPNNKYGLRDIDLLASMIEANNFHVETMEVKKNADDTYTIVAGHRRHAAWKKLLDAKITSKRTLPCIIREFPEVHFTVNGDNGEERVDFDAEQMSLVGLILSNMGQRKEKTLEEQLWEIEQLEPYARALWRLKRANEKFKGSFRTFFAKEILEISPSVLQRKKSLQKLSDKARKALYDENLISETTAAEIANMPQEDQDLFVDAVRAGEITGTVEEANKQKKKAFVGTSEEPEPKEINEDLIHIDMNKNEAAMSELSPKEKSRDVERYETLKTFSEKEHQESSPTNSAPEAIEDPQKEAEAWFRKAMLTSCQTILSDAKQAQILAEEQGNTIEAAQWGIRVSVAQYRIAKLKE